MYDFHCYGNYKENRRKRTTHGSDALPNSGPAPFPFDNPHPLDINLKQNSRQSKYQKGTGGNFVFQASPQNEIYHIYFKEGRCQGIEERPQIGQCAPESDASESPCDKVRQLVWRPSLSRGAPVPQDSASELRGARPYNIWDASQRLRPVPVGAPVPSAAPVLCDPPLSSYRVVNVGAL